MLVGINNKWKHVKHHFTGNSFSNKTLKNIILQIIAKAKQIDFCVNFLT